MKYSNVTPKESPDSLEGNYTKAIHFFILTIISAIFLPLNLVVGFFGMNTSGLPFTEGNNGTLSVIVTLGLLTIVTYLTFLLWRRKIER